MTNNSDLIEQLITQGKLSDNLTESKLAEDFQKHWETLKKQRGDNNAEN